MSDLLSSIISGILGLLTGTIGFYFANNYLERRRESLSTKKEQLKYFYAPLEIHIRINGQEFKRFFEENTTKSDRIFIEKNIWYPNNCEIKNIIFENSHLLSEMPAEILKLINHINVWLSVYELVYIQNEQDPPVFAGPKGYGYPNEVDEYIISRADALRKELTR